MVKSSTNDDSRCWLLPIGVPLKKCVNGLIIYSYLNESLLLDKSLIAVQFHGISEAELQRALQNYRDFCISNFDELLTEISPEDGRLRLFAGENVDERVLKQRAFYLDAIVVSDPLCSLAKPPHELASGFMEALHLPNQKAIDRKALAQAAKTLVSCRTLVACGYVHFFPTSLEFESPKELPVFVSDDGFESILPPHLLSHYKEKAQVRSVRASPHGLLVLKNLEIGRMISVDFDGKESGHSFGFNLAQQSLTSFDRQSGRAKYSMTMPEAPPSQETFASWVSGSVNRAAWMHFDRLSREVRWSSRFGAQYMTRSLFASSVLEARYFVVHH
ncbi:hypothetical protein D3C86_621840 [compost metagenome]